MCSKKDNQSPRKAQRRKKSSSDMLVIASALSKKRMRIDQAKTSCEPAAPPANWLLSTAPRAPGRRSIFLPIRRPTKKTANFEGLPTIPAGGNEPTVASEKFGSGVWTILTFSAVFMTGTLSLKVGEIQILERTNRRISSGCEGSTTLLKTFR